MSRVHVESRARASEARGTTTRSRHSLWRTGTPSIVAIFCLQSCRKPFGGALSGFKLRDGGTVPVICPTGQMFSCAKHHAGGTMLLCMGLFSIFWLGANTASSRRRPGSIRCGVNVLHGGSNLLIGPSPNSLPGLSVPASPGRRVRRRYRAAFSFLNFTFLPSASRVAM
jgi:hypothetical protein